MNPGKGVQHIKRILSNLKLTHCFKKFLDINLINDHYEIPCTLINGKKIKFLISSKTNQIYLILFEKSKIPIFTKNKDDKEVQGIVKTAFLEIFNVKDGDFYVGLFKLYLEILRFFKKNKDQYELFILDELNYKSDVQQIAFILDGLHRTTEYKKLLFEYHDVV